MTPLDDALVRVRNELTDKHGAFRAFVLLRREDVPKKWDLLLSAPWGDDDPDEALRDTVKSLKSALSPSDRRQIPRIVWLHPSEMNEKWLGALREIGAAMNVKNSRVVVKDCIFNGVPIREAVLFEIDFSL